MQFIRNLSKREVIFILVVVLLLVGAGVYAWRITQEDSKDAEAIDSFSACVAAGNPIMETYPEQCRAGDKTFVNPEQQDLEPVEDSANMFDIPELMVKFILTQDLSGLYYDIKQNNPTTAYFSLEELRATDCAADKTAQVALTMMTESKASEMSQSERDNMMLINGFYYQVGRGQASCSDDAAIQKKADDMRTSLTATINDSLQAR